ncbi:MAG: SMP-30/gluconolactonase/LRE family protein [Planctomycetota bacterium]
MLLSCFANNGSAQVPKTVGQIEILSSAAERYLNTDTKIEVLAGGFTWTEGPVWNEDDAGGHLLFSDIPRNTIYRWSAARGIETFLHPSGYTGVTYYGLEPGSNGLAIDAKGQLTMCEHGDRRISVLTRGGGKRTLVDHFQGKRLNSPNDLTFGPSGELYFTDPIYGLPDRANDPRRELDFCGVYRLATNGSLTLLTKELARPNGIGLSPDAKTLYVAQSDSARPVWMAYPFDIDGNIGSGTELFSAKRFMKDQPGAPDGLTVAKDGTLFASGPGGVYLITPAGKLIARILVGGRVSNCTFDSDESYLYITADDKLCRVRMN